MKILNTIPDISKKILRVPDAALFLNESFMVNLVRYYRVDPAFIEARPYSRKYVLCLWDGLPLAIQHTKNTFMFVTVKSRRLRGKGNLYTIRTP